jgi:alkane 1-monooxygenase
MRPVRTVLPAMGYGVGLLPPLLLWLGFVFDLQALAFLVLIGVFPLLRALLGDAKPALQQYGEWTATALHYFPYVLAVGYVASLVDVLVRMAGRPLASDDLPAYGVSIWAVNMFASCVAHDLLHRREVSARLLGRVLAGMVLYPLLEHEHRRHHLRPGDIVHAEWPARHETAWGFSCRRFRSTLIFAWRVERTKGEFSGWQWPEGMFLSCLVSVAFLVLVGRCGGDAIAGVHLIAAVVLAWSLHVMTYVQHWGLAQSPEIARPMSWEDRCRLQAWLTLNLSFHHAHHEQPGRPYYRLCPSTSAPRAPAGYVILFFCALAPKVWFALMDPVLDAWLANPAAQRSVGRRLICFGGRSAPETDKIE